MIAANANVVVMTRMPRIIRMLVTQNHPLRHVRLRFYLHLVQWIWSKTLSKRERVTVK
jgi:hypothetical protein